MAETRKKVYTDKKKFNIANQAYQDSLNLFNRGEKKLQYWRNNSNATNSELNLMEDKIDKSFPVSKSSSGFGSNIINSISMQPIGSGHFLRNVPLYKKPVQPVIFQNSINFKYPLNNSIAFNDSTIKNDKYLQEVNKQSNKPISFQKNDKGEYHFEYNKQPIKQQVDIKPEVIKQVPVEQPKTTNTQVQKYTAARALELQGKSPGYINKGDNTGRKQLAEGGWLDALPVLQQNTNYSKRSAVDTSNIKYQEGGELDNSAQADNTRVVKPIIKDDMALWKANQLKNKENAGNIKSIKQMPVQTLTREDARKGIKFGVDVASIMYPPLVPVASAMDMYYGDKTGAAIGLVPGAKNFIANKNMATKLATKMFNAGVPNKVVTPIKKGIREAGKYIAGSAELADRKSDLIDPFIEKKHAKGGKLNLKPVYKDFLKTVNPEYLSNDYNLKDAYKELDYSKTSAWAKDPKKNHLPDTYKLPNHSTFSIESKYYKPGMKAGYWEGDVYKPILQKATTIPKSQQEAQAMLDNKEYQKQQWKDSVPQWNPNRKPATGRVEESASPLDLIGPGLITGAENAIAKSVVKKGFTPALDLAEIESTNPNIWRLKDAYNKADIGSKISRSSPAKLIFDKSKKVVSDANPAFKQPIKGTTQQEIINNAFGRTNLPSRNVRDLNTGKYPGELANGGKLKKFSVGGLLPNRVQEYNPQTGGYDKLSFGDSRQVKNDLFTSSNQYAATTTSDNKGQYNNYNSTYNQGTGNYRIPIDSGFNLNTVVGGDSSGSGRPSSRPMILKNGGKITKNNKSNWLDNLK